MPETKPWPLLFGIILSYCLLGCCMTQPVARRTTRVIPSCLTGPVPHIGNEWADELYGLMRRELDRANRASPTVHAHILELLPGLFPAENDMGDRPSCMTEYIELASRESFKRKPVEYSRLLLARVEAINSLLRGRMLRESEETFFPRLFKLPESELTEYRLMPGEAGPPPPKSLLRYRVLAGVADSKGNKEAQALALGRLMTSRDDHELVLLEFVLDRFFYQGDPKSPEARSLMSSLMEELRVRLAGPASPVSLELALQRILLIGEHGERFGVAEPMRSLIQDVLRVNGEMPITRGIDGAAEKLAATAYTTLRGFEQPCSSGCMDPRNASGVWRQKFLQELPAMEFPEADRRTRVQDLETELAGLRFWAPRCYVLKELARYADPDNAERLFRAIAGPILKDGRVRSVNETYCRLEAAASIELVSEESRVALLIRVWSATMNMDWLEVERLNRVDGDPAEDDRMPGRSNPHWFLRNHVEWIERHRSLRDWLTANQHNYLVALYLDHVLAFHSSKDPAAEPEVGRSIMRTWMDDIRAAEKKFKDTSRRPYKESYINDILTMAKFAVRYGMRDELMAFFDELEPTRQPAREGSMITTLSGGFPEPLGLATYLMNRPSGP